MSPEFRRPSLLRSPLLWLGLVVIVFLGWAWCDSATRWSYFHWGPFVPSSRDSGLSIYHSQGSWSAPDVTVNTTFFKDHGSRTGRPRLARPGYVRGGIGEEEVRELESAGTLRGQSLDPLVRDFSYGRSRRESLLFIPYWCVMTGALALWLGLIYWRYRRIRRHAGVAVVEDAVHDSDARHES